MGTFTFVFFFFFFFLCLFFKMAKKVEQKSKEAKVKAAQSSGKSKKKKWSKGKTRDMLNNAVLFDQATYDRLMKEVPLFKMVTVSNVSERLKVNGSLARRAIAHLAKEGHIKPIEKHSSQLIYTRAVAAAED